MKVKYGDEAHITSCCGNQRCSKHLPDTIRHTRQKQSTPIQQPGSQRDQHKFLLTRTLRISPGDFWEPVGQTRGESKTTHDRILERTEL